MYQILDIFFVLFHTALILFNLFGWIWEKSRMLHLGTLSLTAFSWVVLGFWYGFGYCPSTDWHWIVRRKMGDSDLPTSYIKFLIDRLTGLEFAAKTVDIWTGIFFAFAFGLSIYLNLKDGGHV